MTQVNLLPPEVKSRQRVRRLTLAMVGAVVAAIVLLFGVFAVQSARLHQVNHQLAAEDAVNAGLNTKIAQLQRFEGLRKSVQARQAIVDGLLHEQVLWSQLLADLSAAMPAGVWLDSLTGQSGATSTGATGTGGNLVGNLSFEGKALTFHDVSEFLRHMGRVHGWVNSWVTTASHSDTAGVLTFSATVDLSSAATVNGRPK